VRIVARGPRGETPAHEAQAAGVAGGRTRRARFAGAWIDAPVRERRALLEGDAVGGPALIVEERTTTVVEPGWEAARDDAGAIVLRRTGDETGAGIGERPRMIRRELLANRFDAIAEEMGEMLQRTALSTNVKERRDFSCALLDPEGRLVVSAPHIPVHLGAMGLCVRALIAHRELAPGDVVVTNHPAFGGSHLPDVTVVMPVDDEAGVRLGYAAARAHHAEIGGLRPGSMSPEARTLAEEGVVIPPTLIGRGDVIDDEPLRSLLTSGAHPSRAPEDNLADVHAAVAALRRGEELLLRAAEEADADGLLDAMNELTERAGRRLAHALGRLEPGERIAEERLDDGGAIRVRMVIGDAGAVVDFAGTSGVRENSLNTPLAVVRSAVLYALRVLVGEELPLNEGLFGPVDVRVPEGMLNPAFVEDPAACPAVAGGNVETSQRIANALLRALELSASSQGTMNNLVFGRTADDRAHGFGYYETIGGGAGATARAPGASGVHTHMTNTAITDPEVLEHRYPVRLRRFAIRRGSGGAGRHPGGDGLVREMEFLAPMSLCLLTQHRDSGPEGLDGAGPGAPGGRGGGRRGGRCARDRDAGRGRLG